MSFSYSDIYEDDEDSSEEFALKPRKVNSQLSKEIFDPPLTSKSTISSAKKNKKSHDLLSAIFDDSRHKTDKRNEKMKKRTFVLWDSTQKEKPLHITEKKIRKDNDEQIKDKNETTYNSVPPHNDNEKHEEEEEEEGERKKCK
eukprot:MONOS_1069.1-p1 / transcript=MONOS_1069.1 / gene=MONOS_1069 / organism=Monocercomonoides_exilis_PA203 / gene_product=unspecified product / transcript_product=unspecified product / location=Mono_scaffold00018:83117-83657(-) / protein_length=143 / sequence_SO=supercontig / SO=protein_coding / is_pseudo=false